MLNRGLVCLWSAAVREAQTMVKVVRRGGWLMKEIEVDEMDGCGAVFDDERDGLDASYTSVAAK